MKKKQIKKSIIMALFMIVPLATTAVVLTSCTGQSASSSRKTPSCH